MHCVAHNIHMNYFIRHAVNLCQCQYIVLGMVRYEKFDLFHGT